MKSNCNVINFMIMNKLIEIIAKPNMYIYCISDIMLNVCLEVCNFIICTNMVYQQLISCLKIYMVLYKNKISSSQFDLIKIVVHFMIMKILINLSQKHAQFKKIYIWKGEGIIVLNILRTLHGIFLYLYRKNSNFKQLKLGLTLHDYVCFDNVCCCCFCVEEILKEMCASMPIF